MNFAALKTIVTSKAALSVLRVQKNSPQLLFAGGVVGLVSTAVLTARGTLQAEVVLEEIEEDRRKSAYVRTHHPDQYSDSDRRKDLVITYSKGIAGLLRAYGPAIMAGAATIACFGGAQNILTKRNVALTAAYSSLEKSFSEYRKRVLATYDGAEADRQLKYPTEIVDVTDEKGKVVGKKAQVDIDGFKQGHSQYAKLFGPGNQNWSPEPTYNLMFLRGQQSMANTRLQARGYLMLNDVYDALGMDRTPAGQIVGWYYDKNGHHEGDNYVDFGIFTSNSMDRVHDFVTGREGHLLLDFNVDGPVFEYI